MCRYQSPVTFGTKEKMDDYEARSEVHSGLLQDFLTNFWMLVLLADTRDPVVTGKTGGTGKMGTMSMCSGLTCDSEMSACDF